MGSTTIRNRNPYCWMAMLLVLSSSLPSMRRSRNNSNMVAYAFITEQRRSMLYSKSMDNRRRDRLLPYPLWASTSTSSRSSSTSATTTRKRQPQSNNNNNRRKRGRQSLNDDDDSSSPSSNKRSRRDSSSRISNTSLQMLLKAASAAAAANNASSEPPSTTATSSITQTTKRKRGRPSLKDQRNSSKGGSKKPNASKGKNASESKKTSSVRIKKNGTKKDTNDEAAAAAAAGLAAVTRIAAVQPKKAISTEKRILAMNAMTRMITNNKNSFQSSQEVEFLANNLEYFDDDGRNNDDYNDEYNDGSDGAEEEQRRRPRGRPEMVPGAMKIETMQKYRQNQQQQEQFSAVDEDPTPSSPPVVKRKRGRPRKNSQVKGINEKDDIDFEGPMMVNNDNYEQQEPTKKRRRGHVKTNLPTPRKDKGGSNSGGPESNVATPDLASFSKNSNSDPLNLQKYYMTELLTREEEYILGMETYLLMKCHDVHEGLMLDYNRMPTIDEWAVACGYTVDHSDQTELQSQTYRQDNNSNNNSKDDELDLSTIIRLSNSEDIDELIRPTGYDTYFEKEDPDMFVGPGLASLNKGPGRGRGRVQKPPPKCLGEIYFDKKKKPRKNAASKKKKMSVPEEEIPLRPMNHGTKYDFIHMLLKGKESKQRMVQCNMRLVVSIARKYSNVGVNIQDLVQEGSLGLSRAAEKFDPKKGFKFCTYASWWIQQAVFRSMAYHSRTIRLPVHVHNLLNRRRRIKISLTEQLGRDPTEKEIARELDMPVDKYSKVLRLTKRSISLEVPKYSQNPKDLGHESEDVLGESIDSLTDQLRQSPSSGSGGNSIAASIKNSVNVADAIIASNGGVATTPGSGDGGMNDDDMLSPQLKVDRLLFHDDLNEMLSSVLEEDEMKVIRCRYGLDDGLTRTVSQVASILDESKSYIRSQECRALRKLRRPWYEKRLKEHQDSLSI